MLLRKYISHCPTGMLDKGLFLSAFQTSKAGQNVWYRKQFIGHNTLKQMVSSIMAEAGFGDRGNYTNHSLRASKATRLFERGVDEQLIAEQTEHRSLSALRKYKRTSDNLKKEVSDLLQPSSSDSKTAESNTTTTDTDPLEQSQEQQSVVNKRLKTNNESGQFVLNVFGGTVNFHVK